jgi:hypothetical protein
VLTIDTGLGNARLTNRRTKSKDWALLVGLKWRRPFMLRVKGPDKMIALHRRKRWGTPRMPHRGARREASRRRHPAV